MRSDKPSALASLARAGLSPLALSREQASAYVGVSVATFDTLVRDGTMPPPVQLRSRLLWDRVELDAAWDRLLKAQGRPRQPSAGHNPAEDIWGRAEL